MNSHHFYQNVTKWSSAFIQKYITTTHLETAMIAPNSRCFCHPPATFRGVGWFLWHGPGRVSLFSQNTRVRSTYFQPDLQSTPLHQDITQPWLDYMYYVHRRRIVRAPRSRRPTCWAKRRQLLTCKVSSCRLLAPRGRQRRAQFAAAEGRAQFYICVVKRVHHNSVRTYVCSVICFVRKDFRIVALCVTIL